MTHNLFQKNFLSVFGLLHAARQLLRWPPVAFLTSSSFFSSSGLVKKER